MNRQPNAPVEKYRRITFNLAKNKIKKFRKNVRVSLDFGQNNAIKDPTAVAVNGKNKVSALKKVKRS